MSELDRLGSTSKSTSAGAQSDLIKVALSEDRRVVRDAVAALIEGTEGFRCTGSFRTMEQALAEIGRDLPDVVLSDIGLPGMSGIQGVGILKERYPAMLLLILSVYEDDERIFDALCAGACGYLLKQTEPSELLKSLREAVTGGAPMSPEVANKVIKLFREVRPPEKADYNLTPHEIRLLKMLTEGYNYVSAAEKLGISYNTLKFHVRNIYDKLQVHSQSEALAIAVRDRLV